MEYRERTYRQYYRQDDLVHFQVVVRETDLDIGIRRECFSPKLVTWVERLVKKCREPLEKYIQQDPAFLSALTPHELLPGAPPIVVQMSQAARRADVGPMAAVAGTIAEQVGRALCRYSKEVIVENGGDIYLRTSCIRRIGIFAGKSPLSYRLALEIRPKDTPVGICTSSGTVGHSLSFGKADAVVVLSSSAPLADAVATATGNLVQSAEDLPRAVEYASSIEGVSGVVIIKEERLAAWGRIRLVPFWYL